MRMSANDAMGTTAKHTAKAYKKACNSKQEKPPLA
eukprot:CAMPEP_0169138602 /NCGR_PEP_ID=MMETSP1015-20121227/42376_1 /TAXON_ID=342587 /ORGANISM="Karlodinium micrum, Strain CCMP2283" /LENGTH=34 /DNA_ID= /DNA_START= /DNA_END= /DNA_ORIENTATION=